MTVGVFFGGKSCEHNVSVVTGLQALADFPPEHRAVPVYIDSDGVWYTDKSYGDIGQYEDGKPRKKGKAVHLRPASPYLYDARGRRVACIDVALLCNHGVGGEDGSLQGLLELSGIPYTGSGIFASAAGMDKQQMKRLFAEAGLPILPCVTMTAEEYVADAYTFMEQVKDKLSFPLIVKPCNLGSSIGISIAHDYYELFAAVRVALEWDTRVLVEHALEDFEEFNCAVLCGEASEVEKPTGWKEFLRYEDKYLSKSGIERQFPAQIDGDLRERIRTLAVAAARAVGADGVARADFLYKDGELYLNEINTIPGSLASYFYEGGTPYVIRALLSQALHVHKQKSRRKFAYTPYRGEHVKK